MYSYQNANSLRDDKAALGCYFREKSLEPSSMGLAQKLEGKVFRQRLSAPLMPRLSQLQGVVPMTRDIKLLKFKLENNQIKGTQR